MRGYTIADVEIDENQLKQLYYKTKRIKNLPDDSDLDYIFETALKNRSLFPKVSYVKSEVPEMYLNRWIDKYVLACNHLPSARPANPKSTCTDPAIAIIVKETKGIPNEEIDKGELYHNLFMSAENVQGNLLEEYIAKKIRPYGFIWCQGDTLKAIDFCNTDGTCLLQIKNKNNTENSSSQNIRSGTSIIKWYRLGTKIVRSLKTPSYKWDYLNELVNKYKTQGFHLPPCNINEEDYIKFLIEVSRKNRHLVTDK